MRNGEEKEKKEWGKGGEGRVRNGEEIERKEWGKGECDKGKIKWERRVGEDGKRKV